MSILIFILVLVFFIYLHILRLSFSIRSVTALTTGVLLGVCVNNVTFLMPDNGFTSLVHIIGTTYVNLLKMLIVPLVLTAIIHSIVNLRHHQGEYLARMAGKTVIMLLVLTGVSAVIGALVGYIMNTGVGINLGDSVKSPPHQTDLASTLLGMLPANPVKAMVNGNVIALVIFATLLGFAALKVYKDNNEKAEPFINFVFSAFEIIKRLAGIVIALTPYGVFALMTQMTINHGLNTLLVMLHFIEAMYIAMMVVLILHTGLVMLSGMNPVRYYRQVWQALLVAFSTRSSFGTMPVTMRVLQTNLGLSESVSSFAPGIGATIGMNACAGIYPAMLVVTTLVIMGDPITWQTILLLGLVNMVASLGVSGIPGVGIVAASVTFSMLGLPFNFVALAQGIDPILDMGRTATNINGVMSTAVVVDRTTASP